LNYLIECNGLCVYSYLFCRQEDCGVL